MGVGAGVLLDDRQHQSVRAVIGSLLARATTADFAIARVRLAAVDLTQDELVNVQRCRVLLGRLDVETLVAPVGAGEADALGAGRLKPLREFLDSGRIEIRTVGSPLWIPDFSIFSGIAPDAGTPGGAVCLVGAHYFARPFPTRGPALTCVLSNRESVTSAAARFEELWDLGYDVLPVIAETLDALLSGLHHAAP